MGVQHDRSPMVVDQPAMGQFLQAPESNVPPFHRCYSTSAIDEPNKLLHPSSCHDPHALASDLSYSLDDPHMIGDHTRPYFLPIIQSTGAAKGGVTAIDGAVLASLLMGQRAVPAKLKLQLIDCRYPFEYDGGHVRNAINIWHEQEMRDLIFNDKRVGSNLADADSKTVLIFYCEFSQERGPRMYNAVRTMDRSRNNYPLLNYPEMYLLEGGYRKFFSRFPHLCDPQSYTCMRDKRFTKSLQDCRKLSSSVSHRLNSSSMRLQRTTSEVQQQSAGHQREVTLSRSTSFMGTKRGLFRSVNV
jgi:hypothetical protein